MVQTEWRSPTGSAQLDKSSCKARFVLYDQRVKNSPLHNHGDQQTELTVYRAKVQLKSRAATSDNRLKGSSHKLSPDLILKAERSWDFNSTVCGR